MTSDQIKTIHIAAKQLKLEDAQYRMLLRNVAGVETCKALSNLALEAVMGVMEQMGFRSPGKPETYWRDKVAAEHAGLVNSRTVWTIHELAAKVPIHAGGFCLRMTSGRTDRPSKLTSHEGYVVIEGLKAQLKRKTSPDREGGVPFITESNATEADKEAAFKEQPRQVGTSTQEQDCSPFDSRLSTISPAEILHLYAAARSVEMPRDMVFAWVKESCGVTPPAAMRYHQYAQFLAHLERTMGYHEPDQDPDYWQERAAIAIEDEVADLGDNPSTSHDRKGVEREAIQNENAPLPSVERIRTIDDLTPAERAADDAFCPF